MITDESLMDKFVSQEMKIYFERKNDGSSPEDIEAKVCELLKFLILVEHFPGNIIFGKEIDEIWHLWIMQTLQYNELCKQLPGNFFRHHSSKDYPELGGSRASDWEGEPSLDPVVEQTETRPTRRANRQVFLGKVERIISFFVTYHINFGPLEADRIRLWPPLDRLVSRLGWTPSELNQFLALHAQRTLQAGAAR